jgi:hypothetical protein
MQCTNHLKQLGLGVHNFHSTYNALPPICVYQQKQTIYGLLLPYLEAQGVFDFMKTNCPTWKEPSTTAAIDTWMGTTLTPEQFVQISSLSWAKCPSRRSGAIYVLRDTNPVDTSYINTGPVVDYVAVVTRPLEGDWSHYCYRSTTAARKQDTFLGPFTLPDLTPVAGTTIGQASDGDGDVRNIASWTAKAAMSRWKDGSSNQLIFGEKFIPNWAITMSSGPKERESRRWDGGMFDVHVNRPFNIARLIHGELTGTNAKYPIIPTGPNDPYFVPGAPPNQGFTGATAERPQTWGRGGFGGMHPGVVNFLIGDGAVRTISVSIDQLNVLYPLGDIQDGVSVSLP